MASSSHVIEFNHSRINLKDERLVFKGFSVIHSFFSFPKYPFNDRDLNNRRISKCYEIQNNSNVSGNRNNRMIHIFFSFLKYPFIDRDLNNSWISKHHGIQNSNVCGNWNNRMRFVRIIMSHHSKIYNISHKEVAK